MKEEGGRVLRITDTQEGVCCKQMVQSGPALPDPPDSCTRSSVEVSLDLLPNSEYIMSFQWKRWPCVLVCVCVQAYECVCVRVRGKVMWGRRHDWWQWGVIVIESITPHSTLCQEHARTHTHIHTHMHGLSHGSFWHCPDKERDW